MAFMRAASTTPISRASSGRQRQSPMSRTEARRLSGKVPAGALSLATGFALLLSGCGIAANAIPSAWAKAVEAESTEPAKETWLALGARLLAEGDNEGAHR